MKHNLLQIEELNLSIRGQKGDVQILKNLSLNLKRGQTLGLVGESGCGKSMTSLAIMGLLPEQATLSAKTLKFENQDLLQLNEEGYSKLRAKKISMIFQDPMSALNPCFSVGEQIKETLKFHSPELKKDDLEKKALEVLQDVGIPDPKERLKSYPHQLSGGMAQRVMIAQAICLGPDLLIADEPTTALDVTIQAQILRLLKDLQKKYQMGLILITHDIGVVANMADEMCVMYAGEIVERSSVSELINSPLHPYTKGLLDSLPATHAKHKEHLYSIPGMVPNLLERPVGCQFHPRCQKAQNNCRMGEINLVQREKHSYRCLYPLESH